MVLFLNDLLPEQLQANMDCLLAGLDSLKLDPSAEVCGGGDKEGGEGGSLKREPESATASHRRLC